MKHEYNEYGEITNANYFNGKNCVGMTYNKGNNYAKNNKGKKYNKVHTQTNGKTVDSRKLVKVAVFMQNDFVKAACLWFSDGSVQDLDNKIPRFVKEFMRNTHKVQNDYYHGDTYSYSDITYSKWFKHSHYNTIDLDEKRGDETC